MAYLVLSLSSLLALGTFVEGSPTVLYQREAAILNTSSLPSNVQFYDPRSFTVIGGNSSRSETELWTPSNVLGSNSTVAFQAFHQDFLKLLGSAPSLKIISENNESYYFAHEAPIWKPDTNELFFCSNAGNPLGDSGLNKNNKLWKLFLGDLAQGDTTYLTPEEVVPEPAIEMTNGGTPYKGNLLFTTEGRGQRPATLSLVNPVAPYNSTVLLDNFFGRRFNSLNDVAIHQATGQIVFTDTLYGYLQDFKAYPQLPEQVYSFDPVTGIIRALADGFGHVNGVVLSGDGKKVYLTDTGSMNGTVNPYLPSTVYSYDVKEDEGQLSFENRKLFAYIDTGVPDGIKLDQKGNVYTGCGDGVHVFNPQGVLLGKVFLGQTSANLAFVGGNKLAILAETKVFLAQFGDDVEGEELW